MLGILISGPKQADNDIDVFLEPLMEDIKKLWEDGVRAWDAYKQESFTLYAMIFVTINDNPARLRVTDSSSNHLMYQMSELVSTTLRVLQLLKTCLQATMGPHLNRL